MGAGLEPAFAAGRPVWPLAAAALAELERDDPSLGIPRGAVSGWRDAPEAGLPADRDGHIGGSAPESLRPRSAGLPSGRQKWRLALAASCLFHVALGLAFLKIADDGVLIEGSEQSGVAFLGKSSQDQIASGAAFADALNVTMIAMLEAKPVETVDAQAVTSTEPADRVEPIAPDGSAVEAIEAEKAEPVPAAAALQAEPAGMVKAEPADALQAEPAEPPAAAQAADTAPEILATDRPDPIESDIVAPTAAETLQAEPVAAPLAAEAGEAAAEVPNTPVSTPDAAEAIEPMETPAAEPVKSEPAEIEQAEPAEAVAEVQPAEPVTETRVAALAEPAARRAPIEEPAKHLERKLPAEKKAEVVKTKKPARKPAAKALGSGGSNQTDARKGAADGQATGANAAASKSGRSSAAGNAAVSNYPGEVAAKLRRSLRYPAEARRDRLRGVVRVSFVVSASGGVGAIRVASSSGSPILDSAALETVRRAAPFPAIPAGAGRSSWPFTVPLAFSR